MMSNELLVLESPKLQQLFADLQTLGSETIQSFWHEISTQGAPLIEPDRDGFAWVTFVWRDDGIARNIAVLQDFGTDGIREHHMKRLPESDLWYLTRRLRTDTRTTYQLSPSPSQDPTVQGPYQLDPLNPKTFPGLLFEDGNSIPFSLLELPDAPSLPWRQATLAKRGTVELYTPFADQRRLWLYTPAVASSTLFPVLIVFDGRIYKELLHLPQMLDYLIDTGQLPPIVALMVDNVDRSELPCQPTFAAYVAEVIMPWLRTQQPITTDPQQTVVAGSSFGGLAALFLGARYPQIFGTVFSQTGWFRWMPEGDPEHHWLTRQFAASPQLPLRILLQVGNLEVAQMADGGPNQVAANRQMRDTLQAKGYSLGYQEISGGHDASSWQAPLAQGLVALFGNQ